MSSSTPELSGPDKFIAKLGNNVVERDIVTVGLSKYVSKPNNYDAVQGKYFVKLGKYVVKP